MSKDIANERKGKELLKYAEQHGCQSRHGHGDHVVVYKGNSQTVIPMHRELHTGTQCSIIKWFKAVGILCLPVAFVLLLQGVQ